MGLSRQLQYHNTLNNFFCVRDNILIDKGRNIARSDCIVLPQKGFFTTISGCFRPNIF
jgi:hypothetical protein